MAGVQSDPHVDTAVESFHQALDAAGYREPAHKRVTSHSMSRVDMNAHTVVEALLRAGWSPPQHDNEAER